MPITTLEEAFQSFGLSPAEAAAAAAENRAHHFASSGYHGRRISSSSPVSSWKGTDEEEEREGETEADEIDLVEAAEEYIAKGDYEQGQKLLHLCLMTAMHDHGLAVVKLRVLVRLGEMHAKKQEWQNAIERFREAFELWQGCRWLADADRTIHPVSFLPNWAECYDRVGKRDDAMKTKEKAAKFADKYSEYWDHLS